MKVTVQQAFFIVTLTGMLNFCSQAAPLKTVEIYGNEFALSTPELQRQFEDSETLFWKSDYADALEKLKLTMAGMSVHSTNRSKDEFLCLTLKSKVLFEIGEVVDARATLSKALASAERDFGTNWFCLCWLLTEQAELDFLCGDTKRAELQSNKALLLAEAYYGTNHYVTAMIQLSLAKFHGQEYPKLVEQASKRLLMLTRDKFPNDNQLSVSCLAYEALAQLFQGKAKMADKTSVVSHKRLDLFSFVFAHSRLSATGLDLFQRLFAAT